MYKESAASILPLQKTDSQTAKSGPNTCRCTGQIFGVNIFISFKKEEQGEVVSTCYQGQYASLF